MGILDRIFGKRERPPERPLVIEKKEVDIEGLGKIISGIEKRELEAVEEEGKRTAEKANEALFALKAGLAVLSGAQLTEEHKERDIRAYNIVKGSKGKIISQLSKAVETIKIPEKMDRKALMDLNSSLIELSKAIARNSKNFFYVSTLFGSQMKRIEEALKMFDDVQKDISNYLNSDSFRLLEQIKGKATETKELYESDGKLIEKEGEIKKLIHEEEGKKEEAEKELKNYRNSKEYEEYEKSLRRANETEQEVEREGVRIRRSISPLMKPLRSLNRIEPNKEKNRLIEGYVENPTEAITKEGGLAEFKRLLSDLDAAIRERRIRVHSEADARERIREITKADMLSIPVARYVKLRTELEELKEKKFGVLEQIEDAENILQQDNKRRLEKELSKIQQKMERNRERTNERKKELEALLSRAGHDVSII